MLPATLRTCCWIAIFLISVSLSTNSFAEPPALPFGSKPLTWEGDIASKMISDIDQFLLKQIEQTSQSRQTHWERDTSSITAYQKLIQKNQSSLKSKLGITQERNAGQHFQILSSIGQTTAIAKNSSTKVYEVQWPVIDQITGQGLLAVPLNRKPKATVILLPDCEQTPEEMFGFIEGTTLHSMLQELLAANCQVLVPRLINRELLEVRRGRFISRREMLHRAAFELGRTVIGYEIQKIQAAIDIIEHSPEGNSSLALVGYGEGGLLALYTSAIDDRINTTVVSGYFNSRQQLWKEPLDRNVFSLLTEFGDAEIATMIAPQKLIIEACEFPAVTLLSQGGAPAEINTPAIEAVKSEVNRVKKLLGQTGKPSSIQLIESPQQPWGQVAAQALFNNLKIARPQANQDNERLNTIRKTDSKNRQQQQYQEIDQHNQALLAESPYNRAKFMQKLSYESLEKYSDSINYYRDYFHNQVIGDFEIPLASANPRLRIFNQEAEYTIYEVVLDVFDEVFAYGLLILPNDIQPNEQRPVVVCQHGLEGRPQSVIGEEKFAAYKAYAVELAKRGFITFAPQNPYIFQDRFRTLQRKSNTIGKTLFSIIVPQHQQITNWLASLPVVDKDRIAFYGLSYGGKTAMRVPALVDNYCLSICSADFNDWVWKNASSRSRYSYLFTGEYEIFEWNLGSTFNYSEMAALIAPRPFMVERGHFDGVAPDERVALEYAKVRHLYAAKLGIADKTEIEFFIGPHSIHGVGTFNFLHKHLKWPQP